MLFNLQKTRGGGKFKDRKKRNTNYFLKRGSGRVLA